MPRGICVLSWQQAGSLRAITIVGGAIGQTFSLSVTIDLVENDIKCTGRRSTIFDYE